MDHNCVRLNIPYQPVLTDYEVRLVLESRFDDLCRHLSDNTHAERSCADRLVLILKALGPAIDKLSFIDFGCANGFFINLFSLLGAKASIGIDNDCHRKTLDLDVPDALELARCDSSKLGLNSQFFNFDISDLIESPRPHLYSDVVLFLAVFHHLFGGYGFLPKNGDKEALGERPRKVLEWLDGHCRKVFFFEMHEGIYSDWTPHTIAFQLKKFTSFRKVRRIGESNGWEGQQRHIWMCTR